VNYPIYIIPLAFLALLACERLFPLRKPMSRFAARFVVNAIVSALALTVALIVVKPVATGVLQRVTERANHAWPLLWRFHNAHHIDPDLDVTTAVRFHFVEIGCSAAFRAVQVALIGGHLWPLSSMSSSFNSTHSFNTAT